MGTNHLAYGTFLATTSNKRSQKFVCTDPNYEEHSLANLPIPVIEILTDGYAFLVSSFSMAGLFVLVIPFTMTAHRDPVVPGNRRTKGEASKAFNPASKVAEKR